MRARRGLAMLASDVGTEIDKVQCDGRAVQVGVVNQAPSVVYCMSAVSDKHSLSHDVSISELSWRGWKCPCVPSMCTVLSG